MADHLRAELVHLILFAVAIGKVLLIIALIAIVPAAAIDTCHRKDGHRG